MGAEGSWCACRRIGAGSPRVTDQAPAVGNTVAAFARTGRPVVLGTFYDQDRSDGPPEFTPHGWGDLETIDPNVTDGVGTSYEPRTLGSSVAHPLTVGVADYNSLWLGNQGQRLIDIVDFVSFHCYDAGGLQAQIEVVEDLGRLFRHASSV